MLCLEFSSSRRSVALIRPGRDSAKPQVLGTASDSGSKPSNPLVLVDEVFRDAGASRDHLQGIVIGLGPGSYTGVRSSIALGQGWALAKPVRLFGIDSSECLAAQAQEAGWFGRASILIDAQRDGFYLATYLLKPEARERIEPLRLIARTELEETLRGRSSFLVGPGVTRWWPEGRDLFPDASALAALWQANSAPTEPEQLEPIYLRDPGFIKAPPPRTVLP
jgi:tRNA threonylcarbamoyl adenosine modification protein YeaZ